MPQPSELPVAELSATTVESYLGSQPVMELSRAAPAAPLPDAAAAAAAAAPPSWPLAALVAGGLLLAGMGIKRVFDTPSRTYDQNVGQEYDAWTEEGVLEYYWGEHIHLGYYSEQARG